GCTNISGGMLMCLKEVRTMYREGQINRVLLLTDGQANTGVTSHKQLIKKAGAMSGSGVALSTFGLGEDFEEELLMAMAEAGGGNFYYIQSPDQVPGIFEQELSGLLNTIAQNLTIKLKPTAGIQLSGVLGYPFSVEDGVLINLPDIYSGETKIVLLELQVSPLKEGTHRLIDFELEYADVRQNLAFVNLKASLEVACTEENSANPAENFEVLKHVELFRSADAKEQAIRLADQGDFEGGKNVLNLQLKNISNLAQMVDDQDLTEEVKELKENISYMDATLFSNESRKQMSFNVYNQKRGRKGSK
ncbi:MAG: VWA domain-containing protein, partial [Peptococcaceae bacterium]|nr:VWA domain-containing protein [Peptococcaceae bacterium]